MKTNNPIAALLSAPLSQEWTVDLLAEQILEAIAEHATDPDNNIILDGEAISDRQSRRLLRPLLACLATKSATEAGTSPNIFNGTLSFKRTGEKGTVWISGDFENTPDIARVALHRSNPTPNTSQSLSIQEEPAPGPSGEEKGSDFEKKPFLSAARTTSTPASRPWVASRRYLAEQWAAEYYNTVAVQPRYSTSRGTVVTSIVSEHAEIMCYEIGRIYRPSWSREDAAKLAIKLDLKDSMVSTGLFAASRIFPLLSWVGIAAAVASAVVTKSDRLESAAKKIIDYFESSQ